MRYLFLTVCMLLGMATPVAAHADLDFNTPGISIGINVPLHPRLVLVPGYPVYYAPNSDLNLFYYNGQYWLFENSNWYASAWTTGPWQLVPPYDVPGYILRIPVRYYENPPTYFFGWNPYEPPLWSEYWGQEWREHRHDWDGLHRWAEPAPLPGFRRFYAGPGIPRIDERPHDFGDHHDFDRPQHDFDRPHHFAGRGDFGARRLGHEDHDGRGR
jgi:hypothetical protein